MSAPRRSATRSTLKTLFALSRNICALPQCEAKLTDPSWGEVLGEVAHIHAERPGGPRWNPDLTEARRWSFDNLLVLCPNCHKRIDRIEPEAFPAEKLRDIKARHEQRGQEAMNWSTDAHLDRVVATVMRVLFPPRQPFTTAVMDTIADHDDAGRALMRSPYTVEVIGALSAMSPSQPFNVRDVADIAELDPDVVYEEFRRLLRAGLIQHGVRRGQWLLTNPSFWASV